VSALIALAMGDVSSARTAVAAFAAAGAAAAPDRDVTMGRAGVLLGCTLLLDAVPTAPAIDIQPILALGDDLTTQLWAELGTLGKIDRCEAEPSLGIAHGWAGFCYAVMRWCQSRRRALPGDLESVLAQLAGLAERSGRGLRWARLVTHRREGVNNYMSGWCNGSAGHVHLWLKAHEVLGEPRFVEVAEGAAWNAWEDRGSDLIADICCGAAGRAYAFLAMHRRTGDRQWLTRAVETADHAASTADPADPDAHSLFKGSVGVALLAAEMERPEMARMPLFEHEGWPGTVR
jgi:serine/threonine-protein kinase